MFAGLIFTYVYSLIAEFQEIVIIVSICFFVHLWGRLENKIKYSEHFKLIIVKPLIIQQHKVQISIPYIPFKQCGR